MNEIKILPTITTLEVKNHNFNSWQEKIKEIEEFGLDEIALFLTGLNYKQRELLYKTLDKVNLNKIPHVHLRNDMDLEELDFLVSRFKVEVFNTHSTKDYPLVYSWDKYKDKIYIENTKTLPTEEELQEFAGLCLDFAHWESAILNNYYDKGLLSELVKKIPIGCGHLSSVKLKSNKKDHSHNMESFKEFDYLEKYLYCAPKIISLELNNSLKEQLQVKDYIEKNILKK